MREGRMNTEYNVLLHLMLWANQGWTVTLRAVAGTWTIAVEAPGLCFRTEPHKNLADAVAAAARVLR